MGGKPEVQKSGKRTDHDEVGGVLGRGVAESRGSRFQAFSRARSSYLGLVLSAKEIDVVLGERAKEETH